MGFSLIYTAHLMSPLKIWQMHPQSNSFFSHLHSQNQFMSKSKLILSELKQILCLQSLSQNGKNIHPITLAGNTEINANTFFSLSSSYLAYSFFLSHLFIQTMTLSPSAHCSAIIINPTQNHPMFTFGLLRSNIVWDDKMFWRKRRR